MSRLRKTFKFIAVGYFWLCLAVPALLIAFSAYAIVFVEQQGPLTKVSLDNKLLARLSGGIYQLKPWGRKDPRASCGIYIQRKISSQRWLVAKQENNLKYLNGGEVDFWWQSDDSLIIETDERFSLTGEEIVVDGHHVKVSLVKKEHD